MTRRTTFEIAQSERLDVAVAAGCEISRRRARALIDAGNVFVDGTRCRVGGRVIDRGTRVLVHRSVSASDSIVPRILFEDPTIVVVDKPAGVHVNETETNQDVSLVEILAADRSEVFVVHRLDRETSGVIVFAKSKDDAARLSEAFAAREVQKVYWALVEHADEAFEVDAPIGNDPRRPRARRVHRDGQSATTHFRKLAAVSELMLIEARPITGRTHQIRVHLAHVGAPIVGDRLYGGVSAVRFGDEVEPAERTMLHARSIRWSEGSVERCFSSAPPDDFLRFARRGLALPSDSE